ncbi:unnamed protein product [Clonostachys byssicola]|uniref:Amidohydrolase-related domain-containing protein n=1 Tax=Clonostachys byssicola TaxID=160290 RepID=A0A9N9UBS6_9HYPO|nr:unnamed protein product [Clonostachys byssicola]
MKTEHAYTLIKDATVLTMDPELGMLSNCDILIKGQTVKAIGQNLPAPSDGDIKVIDIPDAIVTPGFVDGHHHMWQQLIRGVAVDWSLFDYAINIRSVYGSVYTAEDAGFAYYVAALDMINNGITSVLEHGHIMNTPQHADASIKGLKDSGIRACFCYGLYENPPISGAPDADKQSFSLAERLADARRVRNTHFQTNDPAKERVTFGLAPTEPDYQPIQETVDQVVAAREIGARLITMHVALGPYDTTHNHIVQQLADRDLLGPDLAFSHGASLTEGEFKAISSTGAGLVSTPDTELQMGMGFPAVFRATDRGCKACLGVDITSNQGNSFVAQMRLALQVQRAQENEIAFPLSIKRKTAEVLRMSTMGGAEVMGLGHLAGSVTVGKKADLNIFRCDDIGTVPVIDPAGTVVFHSSTSNIDTVIIDGRVVKENGQLVGIDWPALKAELVARTERIRQVASKVDLAAAKAQWGPYTVQD